MPQPIVPQLESGGWGLGHRSLWRAHRVPSDTFITARGQRGRLPSYPKQPGQGAFHRPGTDGLTLYKWTSGKYFL